MKKVKYIGILILLIIIILIVLASMLSNRLAQEKERELNEGSIENHGGETKELTYMIEEVDNGTMFYTASRCVQVYLSYSTLDIDDSMTKEDKNEEIEYTLTAMYNMLSKEYIERNNITQSNISNYVETSNIPLIFYPVNMNYIDGENTKVYSVYGYIENSNTGEYIKDLYCIVSLDINNMTFSIEMLDSNEITNIKEVDFKNNEQTIEKNDYNVFRYNRLDKEALAEKYLDHYKRYAMKYPEKAYNLLDEEYRNARFGSIDAYKEYVNNKEKEIKEITLDKYQTTNQNRYTQYVCIDTNGNYYIFRETATMQFTLLLDTYTVDLPEFTQKYNSGNEQTKVGMNIEKIAQALNAKDYGYIYKKLANGFKNNYFKTQAEFETYAKNNFYDKNIITYNEFAHEGQNYMYAITIKNDNGYSRDKTIFMQLKDDYDFVFSFNV